MVVLALTFLALADEPAEAKEKNQLTTSFNIDTEIRLQRYDPVPLVHTGGSRPRFFEEVTRVVGRANTGRWSFDLQVDQLGFFSMPHIVDGEKGAYTPAMQSACSGTPDSCLANPFRTLTNDRLYINPEKVAATYKGDDVQVTFGDFYASFGVGAVMNINRNVDNDVDTSIQGVRVVAQPGDWKITGLAGTLNRQQVFQDQPNPRLLDGDRRHIVAGLEVQRYRIGATQLGAHGVMYNYVDNEGDPASSIRGMRGPIKAIQRAPDAVIGGATVATTVGGVDLNFEVDGISYSRDAIHPTIFNSGIEEVRPGLALYGSGLWFIGATTWQLELRHFKNVYRLNNPIPVQFGYTVVAPPTLELERAINIDTAAVTGSNDLTGGLLRVDIMASDSASPYVAFGVSRDQDLVNAAQKGPTPETIFQLQSGAEIIAHHWSLLLQTVGRIDVRDEGYAPDRQLYGAADIKAPFPGLAGTQISLVGHSFRPGPQKGMEKDAPMDAWHEVNTSVSLLATSDLGITGFYDNTTNPVAGGNGNLREDWPAAYGAVELFWKPTSSWTFKAFHGGYAAGIRCSGGQCRNVPAFTGTRISVVGTIQ